MLIQYKNKKAEKQFCSDYKKTWKYPSNVKTKLESAENFIRSATSLHDIAMYLPFHFEKLKGDRKDEWSIRVGNTGYRVILYPCDDAGKEIIGGDILALCKSIRIIEVVEVTNHYE